MIISEKTMQEKINQAITKADIEEIRRKTKIGDRITIKTMKACSDSTVDINTKSSFFGSARKAVVVDKSHKRFCVVELATGIRECVLWSSIVIAKRAGKIAVL